ncbi:MAG TPA: hypothetical protein VMY17_03210, partial [Thermoplasmata archaeon]|nr:hypothetical protein [Thermoplasmata archaeon]
MSSEQADDDARPITADISQTSFTGSVLVNVSDDVGRPVPGAYVYIAGNVSRWDTNLSGQVMISGLYA